MTLTDMVTPMSSNNTSPSSILIATAQSTPATDTCRGFHALGFGILLSLLAVVIIHSNFSYPTLPPGHFFPGLFFRVYIAQIHKCKHGSDTGTYDAEASPCRRMPEDVFSKCTDGGEGVVGKADYEGAA